MFQVGGYEPATVIDFEIPKKYGLRQTIADTLGIGGIMRGLRTIPVLLDVCHDMEEVCPDALLLNYVNPMAMHLWASNRASSASASIGLCHSVQGTAEQLAGDIGVPDRRDLRYRCAGINHMAFYLDFERRDRMAGRTCTRRSSSRSRTAGPRKLPGLPCPTRCATRCYDRLGYFVTESSEHFAEYVPWFIKRDRPDLIEKFGVPLDEYLVRCERQIAVGRTMRTELEDPDSTIEV